MAKDVIYGRVGSKGQLHKQHHPSCFGCLSSLYHQALLGPRESYDRRILITTNFDSVTAHRYAKAFRKTMAGKIVFKREIKDQQLAQEFVPELPKIKYYGVDHKSVGINAEMVSVCRQNQSPGYWQLTIPDTVTEYEAYLYVKLFAKIGSMPQVGTEDLAHAFEFFHKQYKGNWRLIITAMGLFGVTSGYNFPFSQNGHYASTLLRDWLTTGIHRVNGSNLHTRKGSVEPMHDVAFFGHPIPNGASRRHISTAINVMPQIAVPSNNGGFQFALGAENFKSYPFEGVTNDPQLTYQRYTSIVAAIKRLLE